MIMRRTIQLAGIFCVILVASSCNHLDDYEKGNGNILTDRHDIDVFNRVDIGGNFEVLLIESDNPSVVVEADENLMAYIIVESDGSKLEIYQTKNIFSSNKLKLKIYYTHLNFINITGAALVENRGKLKSRSLELKLEGAGVVNINVLCETLVADLSGAGKVELSGKTDRQKLSLSGAGGLEAYSLESKECTIEVSGIGSAKVFVTEELTAKLEGLGGIKYIGDPRVINKEVSGIGIIEKGTWKLEETIN